MATPNVLGKIAKERGYENTAAMIKDIVETEGSVLGASRNIKVSPWTITRWIKNNDFTVPTHQSAKLVKREAVADA